ncbi:hypothetical protein [Oceanobacter sp. 4_MG-2023]|uniref:hypothetical protein n=1 Tax=Oceanobacter sp. 4_MG-2023 TaxID=3062623 RepID=UPI002736D3BB|nr:hypothetical protein [Oceanobacter sp. 4_MG-2023]MDP2548163.1 hypothetical protein [Oceanobacter sp. 4_MG-2023]
MEKNISNTAMENEYTVKTFGLSSYEQGIIHKQLQLLRCRTKKPWLYQGEGLDAHLVLARKPIDICPWGILAVMANEHVISDSYNYLHCDWPLRIIGLLDLLHNAEDKLHNRPLGTSTRQDWLNTHASHSGQENVLADTLPSPTLISEQLDNRIQQLAKHQYFELQIQQHQAIVARDDNNRTTIYSDSHSSGLLEALLEPQMPFTITQTQAAPDNASPLSGKHSYPVEQFLWELAWKEPIEDIGSWDNNTVFRIKQWPRLGQWYTEPAMFQLSALYGKKFASLKSGEQLSGLPSNQVAAFLRACTVARLGVVSKETSPAAEPPQQIPAPVSPKRSSNLLGSLRKRLGLAFNL